MFQIIKTFQPLKYTCMLFFQPSAENASQANAIQWQRMRAAVGGHPAYSSYNPAVISVGGVPCPPILAHSLPVSTQAHHSGIYRTGIDMNVNSGASTRESVIAQLHASIPNPPPVLSTHRPHQQQPPLPTHQQQVSVIQSFVSRTAACLILSYTCIGC